MTVIQIWTPNTLWKGEMSTPVQACNKIKASPAYFYARLASLEWFHKPYDEITAGLTPTDQPLSFCYKSSSIAPVAHPTNG